MGVAEEVARIEGAKQVLSDALRERGVYVPYRSRIDDMVRLVREIPTVSAEEVFLLAHPVGSIFRTTGGSPAGEHGGTWRQVPSLGAGMWERTA